MFSVIYFLFYSALVDVSPDSFNIAVTENDDVFYYECHTIGSILYKVLNDLRQKDFT